MGNFVQIYLNIQVTNKIDFIRDEKVKGFSPQKKSRTLLRNYSTENKTKQRTEKSKTLPGPDPFIEGFYPTFRGQIAT